MKRTKENWLHGHPQDRNGISSLSFFDGEDLSYEERKRELQKIQKTWIEEQIKEKEEEKRAQDEEKQTFANFYKGANTLYGQIEDHINVKYKNMQESIRDANLQLAHERKERERIEKEQRIREEQEDLAEQMRSRQVRY